MTIEKRYPPVILSSALIPWTETWQFDEDLFRQVVRALRTQLTDRLYVFGTAGEGYGVTDGVFRTIIRAFCDEMSGAQPMVGVIGLSVPIIVERIATAYELGVRQFQISLPCWGALNDREVEVFFRETCGRFPDCQFLHYNLMRTKRLLTGDDYARLSAAHANLAAIKMGGEDIAAFSAILERAPVLQCFFTEFGFAKVRDHHECGLLIALSAINFPLARRYFAARGSDLARMMEELRGIHRGLKAAVGDEAHIDGAYDKMYAKLHEPHFPLRLLPPYQSASADTFARFKGSLPAAWRVGNDS